MRTALALLAVALAATTALAQPKKYEPKLKIGDHAPPLTVNKWHQGPEVKEFEKGKVYVLVFWMAFNGDANEDFRQIEALISKHKNVIPVAISNLSEKNKSDFEREVRFVADANPKYTFGFANVQSQSVKQDYGIAGSGSMSAVSVIDKDGKLAYTAQGIDCALYLPDVLPKVLDGTWKGQKDADAIAAADREYEKALVWAAKVEPIAADLRKMDQAKQDVILAKIAAESLTTLDEFLKTHPKFAGQTRTLAYQARMARVSNQKEPLVKATEALVADGVARSSAKAMAELAGSIGSMSMRGELGPDIPTDKLVGQILDGALKLKATSIEGNDFRSLIEASMTAGVPEKGQALLNRMFENPPPGLSAEQVAEGKKQLTEQFDERARQIEEERKKNKK